MDPILSIRGVRKSFGDVKAVNGISFDVRKGSITGLLGRNGAGKTTTIRMITGIFMPDEGSIEWRGSASSSFRDEVGYLPEERGLYRQMKVTEQLLFLAQIKGRSAGSVAARAETWLRRFELWDKRDAKVEELSKGNQQKVQLIGTLLHDPELLILDEPMSGLDPVNVKLVRDLLKQLRDEGRTILLSTHMMGEAEKMADDIVLVHGGEVVLSGSLDVVRASEGTNSIIVEYDGDGRFLETLPGVVRATIHNNSAELRLDRDADTQSILHAVVPRLKLSRFEVATPSLEEIFIGRVGVETLAAQTAAQGGVA
ncbi:MAG: ATP-binding cassette domain-containing protein [Acidobacteria bacterium]|nr:ATP-binding cassette domain-containing protein [Acidobacteriota bacterium]